MFKWESYITPILLSYVDKFIKNFRPEDSQVSLWGGDASFHNLDLRLEVLEQELQLPFSFVSGHIHELLIHVPWTKLASEPITITINTIECILKLRGPDTARPVEKVTKEKRASQARRQAMEAPPGYVQSLINRIVSNIRIYCNNLILKYVEEDIVLSMNVKLLTFESADDKWNPAYTAQVILRKLIAINDLTVCLDKRNSSGKIDVYQEPMLYRCSMVVHFLQNYYGKDKNSSTTRFDFYCNSMEFSMTEQQIPMLLRLLFLLQALQQKQLKSEVEIVRDADSSPESLGDPNSDRHQQSLAGWAWSFVPSVFPLREEELEREQIANLGHTTHIGFYVDNASLTFKVSESIGERTTFYSQRKQKYWPLLTMRLQGIFTDFVMHGKKWLQVGMGISEMVMVPIGYCSCSVQDVFENGPVTEYLKAGSISSLHKSDSLFDAEAPENKGQRNVYNTNWDQHIETTSEAVLLERSPAIAVDYLYQLIVPDDMTSENLSELGSDLEYSNLSERALLRVVVGPLRLRICSGFLHRLSSLQAAASAYDYVPYSVPKPEPELQDLQPPSEDDYDALNECIPMRVTQLTILAPVVEFQLMDHPGFEASKDYLFKRRKKMSVHSTSSPSHVELPKVTLECQCLDMRTSNPMYLKRLLRTTCQLPDPPKHMFDACHVHNEIKVIGFCSRLVIGNRQITVLTPSNATYRWKYILMPQYWVSPNTMHREVTVECDSLAFTGTYPKIVVMLHILDKLLKADCGDTNSILNSSLLADAIKNTGLVYLEFCIEGIYFKRVTTNSTTTIDGKLGSIKAFIFEPIDFTFSKQDSSSQLSIVSSQPPFHLTREIQQVLIISGPEFEDDYKNESANKEEALLTITLQCPLIPERQAHPPMLLFNLKEIRVCIDPLLCRWLLYVPKNYPPKSEVLFENQSRKLSRTFSDISTHETPRRSRTPYESIHSSLEQGTSVPPKNVDLLKDDSESEIDFQEKTYNFLKKWFDVWKGLLLYGNMSRCTVYFPIKSLSAVGSQGIQDAVDEAMKKSDPPDIFVVTLPSTTIRNSAHRENLAKFTTVLPISLPEYLWNKKKSSFPWSITVSEFSCYTLQNGCKLNCLSPVSLTSTVGMSTRTSKANAKDANKVSEAVDIGNISGNKNDIGSLGVCIHIDMTPIVMSVSEVQVCLIASILNGLFEVASNILPEARGGEPPEKVDAVPNVESQGSAVSPTLLKESVDSLSEKTPHIRTDDIEQDAVKLTAWIQWTVAKFTVELLAHDSKALDRTDFDYAKFPRLKFVVDAEDIVSSLDFQSVYLKLKSKIGCASVMHYIRDGSSAKWRPGDFLGFVMKTNEDQVVASDRQEDTSFANFTITRASCQHTHTLWGTNKKEKKANDKNDDKNVLQQSSSRYITEIVVNLQPIDILVSPTTLKNYFLVVEPLLTLPSQPPKVVNNNIQINNRTLPLVYLEFHGFRVIMPSVELENRKALHSTCVFQIKRVNLNPTAVNPICRTPCRPDIYQQAARARILNVPGSDVEDRQYQLDVVEISMDTGTWDEISQTFGTHGKNKSVLRTMSENPALEWNNLANSKLNSSHDVKFWPLIGKFDISVVAAPAMTYKNDVVCGHSVEVNFISDIRTTISLSQIDLLFSLLNESSYVFELLSSTKGMKKRPRVIFPYPQHGHVDRDSEEVIDVENFEVTRDSGFETSDFKSSFSIRTKESSYLRKSNDLSERSSAHASPLFGRSTVMAAQPFIPVDVLVTGGKISLTLYEYEKDSKRVMALRTLRSNYECESDKGYEASEEGSSDERPENKKFNPLFYVSLSQPNAFLSDTQIGRKFQVSCFDVSVKITGTERKVLKTIPNEDDFLINLLETKAGEPHPDTGVLPAFFTLKWSKGIGKPSTLDVVIGKPTKILCSISRCMYLLKIHEKMMENFKGNRGQKPTSSESEIQITDVKPVTVVKVSDYYSKFKEIKDMLMGITVLNVQLSQLILTLQTDRGAELTVSFSKLSNHLTISNRPEKLANLTAINCLAVGITSEKETRPLLNPWSLSFETSLFWESWQTTNSNPQVQLTAETDSMVFDVSPDQFACLQLLLEEVDHFAGHFPRGDRTTVEENAAVPAGEKEQHYKDDLRAGAFQFVDSISNNIDELPLPYQVMFWNRNISAMAWRYPQPRALTKVRVFPVPFKISTGNEDEQQVLCHLEYWSECHGCYQSYSQFYLSETDMCHLELPKSYPQPAVACTWRVVLTTPSVKDYNQTRVLISPRALAGCIRIDSYFNKNLIPDLTVALHLGSIRVNFFNYVNKKLPFTLPEPLGQYTPDLIVPEYQQFLSVSVENANAYLATWNFETAVFDVNAVTKALILDYAFLTQQLFVEPFLSKLEISFSKTLGVTYVSKPIHVLFGASAAHTLAVSEQMWSQCLAGGGGGGESQQLVVMTHYVVCNDTNVNLRFGQVGVEDVFLPSRCCHLYAWRSQKCKQMMRVALEENRWIWSEPFRIDQNGMEFCKIADEAATIIVTVKSLSATQKQVTFSALLVICNTLLEHFEMKIFEERDKDRDFKIAQSHIVRGKSTPPSMLIDGGKNYFLRLRFFGLESAWSGDIPLKENTKCAQPWLVKVPLQERGQFLSIWCKIVVEQFPKGTQVLVVLWPLFMIKSNLPVSAKVHIETPTLNVHLESTVKGLGEYQQLYCPGTTENSHQLTFQLDGNPSSFNPYVPLNYSLVDQKQFFKRAENESIAEILSVVNSYDKTLWPYFTEDFEDVEFTADEQPLTHVQVKYQNVCQYSSALLVELLPWSLLVNVLGCTIAIIVNEKELCRIAHYGIVTPPKLEEAFYIGVGIGGTWNMSQPLQLAKSNWSQTFYMPQIKGTIPVEGSIRTTVKCDPYISVLSISSTISNEIRLLKVASSHVLTSYLSLQVHAICLAVPETQYNHRFGRHFDEHYLTLPPHMNKSNAGLSVTQWYSIGKSNDDNVNYALYISLSINPRRDWSCPIRVDKPMIRRGVTMRMDNQSVPVVIVTQEFRNQIYVSVHHDLHPQLLLKNRTGAKLYCAQSANVEATAIVKDSEHFTWLCSADDGQNCYYSMPVISERFPELPQNSVADNLVLASDPERDPQGFLWSSPINLNSFNDQFVRIPFYGDVKVSMKNSVHTVYVTVESVSQVEISARDIRVRLSMHENENQKRNVRREDHHELKAESSTTTLASSYFSAEDSMSTMSTDESRQPRLEMLPIVTKAKNQTNGSRRSSNDWMSSRIIVFVKSVTFTLTSDLENGGAERNEVANLTLDTICLSVNRAEESQVSLSVADFQVDNQMYSKGLYDFPVLLVGEERKPTYDNVQAFNTPICQLVQAAQENCLIKVDLNVETWRNTVINQNLTDIKDLNVQIQPLSIFIEDVYVTKLMDYVSELCPSKLIMWPKKTRKDTQKLNSIAIVVPEHLICGSTIVANPLVLQNFSIEPISILLSVHSSIKLYIALDQSPLSFGKFEKKRVFTTSYRLGHALTMHYLSGAIFGAGWVVGSLELLGSPGGLARAMGTGLRDFVTLPYYGLVQGPWAFLRGVSYGSTSLMKHVTAGTLQSITKLAASVARNLDRLTLDDDHFRRTEESRRQKPQGVTQGFIQGLTGLGISLLGAVGGIAHHPIQSVMADGASPRSFASGVGKGIVGVFTKPLSGAAELLALTGQGLLQGAGWNSLPEPRMSPTMNHIFSSPNSVLKYDWKFTQPMIQGNILLITEATALTNGNQYDAVTLILSSDALMIIDSDEDVSQRILALSELSGVTNNDPTLLCLKLEVPKEPVKVSDEECVEMDPDCRARVADYVRTTVNLMQQPDNAASPEHSEMSISPDVTPCRSPTNIAHEQKLLTFYVPPQNRNYFLCLLTLAKQQASDYMFPVL